MKRYALAGILVALGVILACFMAGQNTRPAPDSHNTTAETTQEATQEQDSNRPLCIGFLNFGSCNVTQSAVQSGAPKLDAQPAEHDDGLEPGTIILIGAGFLFLILAAILPRYAAETEGA